MKPVGERMSDNTMSNIPGRIARTGQVPMATLLERRDIRSYLSDMQDGDFCLWILQDRRMNV